jgi:hypothetical protein
MLTQEFLVQMLGIRRTSVTEVASRIKWQAQSAIPVAPIVCGQCGGRRRCAA